CRLTRSASRVLGRPRPRLHAVREAIPPAPVAAVSRVLRLIVVCTVGPLASSSSLGPARGPTVGRGSRAGPYRVTGFSAWQDRATSCPGAHAAARPAGRVSWHDRPRRRGRGGRGSAERVGDDLPRGLLDLRE